MLSISGFYLFYYLLEVFYPRWYDEPKSMMPSGLEWLWIGHAAHRGGSTVLSISGFYLFYYLLEVFYPRWYDEPKSMMPSGLEWLWIGLTAVVVALATLIASRLTRRIITR